MLDRLRNRLRALLRRGAVEREMQAEMQEHLEKRIAVLAGRGMTPMDARLAALKEFGNVGVLQEEGRDARGSRWLEALLGDVRFALRHFARRRMATATIVVVLSLGIALHAVEVTLLRILTVKPPPGLAASVPLARVRGLVLPSNGTRWEGRWMSYPEVRQITALGGVFESVAISATAGVVVGSRTDPDREVEVMVQFVNDDYFTTLGIGVARGQGLPRSGSGSGGELAAVVSEFTWQYMLGSPDSLSPSRPLALMVNGREVRVVGVAPRRFASMIGSDNPGFTIWMPLGARPVVLGGGASAFALQSPDSGLFEVVGRLRDGVSADSATRAVRRVTAAVYGSIGQPGTLPVARVRYDADAVYLRGITTINADDIKLATGLWAIFSTLILLVVCTNVSGLMASSAAMRGHEIAVRLSLGASRQRIVRQLLTESCLLSFGGGIVGVFVYWLAFRMLPSNPEFEYYAPDAATVMLTLVSTVGVGILFGLTPALHAARGDFRWALSSTGSGATGPSRLQRTLVTAQIALTQPLLVVIATLVGILIMETPKRLPDAVNEQVVKFSIRSSSLGGSPEEQVAAQQRMLARIRELPGVVGAMPDADLRPEVKFSIPEGERAGGREGERAGGREGASEVNAGFRIVQAGYFRMLDVPFLRGDDRIVADSTLTAVIGTDLARMLWGDADPIGRHLDAAFGSGARERFLVTGIYDSRLIGSSDRPVVYRTVSAWWRSRYLVRTSRPASELIVPVRRVVRAELPSTPIENAYTLANEKESQEREMRLMMRVITGSVSVVLLIACIGLYGVVSLGVLQRQREIGIRMALGAHAREVVALFYRGGMRLSLMGLAFGLPISLAGAQIFLSMDDAGIGIQGRPNVLLIGAGVGAVMLAVASLATLFPATRAATVDPVSVLRSE